MCELCRRDPAAQLEAVRSAAEAVVEAWAKQPAAPHQSITDLDYQLAWLNLTLQENQPASEVKS